MASERLILTGFMGVGKSTVGPLAAEELDVNYYDTDEWMETEAGIDIPMLLRSDPAAFRELEARALKVILKRGPGIFSTGGGIVSTEVGRRALLSADATVVCLQVPFDEAARRVSQDSGRERPLFDDAEKARKLYQERLEWYEETANYIVDASRPVDLVVGDIVKIAQAG